jgi:hypothetical protein
MRPFVGGTPARWTISVAFLALLTSGVAAGAQTTRVVQGVVTDGAAPIAGVTIQLPGGRPVITDDSGKFKLEIPHQDRIAFDIRRLGLMPSRFGLNAGGDTTLTIVALRTAQELPKVDVTERERDATMDITGFNERYRDRMNGTNTGYFFTAADIERRRPARMSHLFHELPNVTVCRTIYNETCGLYGKQLMRDPRPGRSNNLIPCVITVYLDGHRLNSLYSPMAERPGSMPDIDGLVSPLDVGGLEYYPSGNRIPAKYQLLNGSCGLVLIWTKRG